MKKKVSMYTYCIIAIIMSISNVVSVLAYGFTDIKGHWAESYINDMLSKGYIDGYPDNTFRPDNYITKAEAGKILGEIFNMPKVEVNYNLFNDVSNNDWYALYAYSAEILLDDSPDNSFDGDDNVKRISAAMAITRLWGIDYSIDSGSSKKYADYKADSSTDTVKNKNGLISIMTDLGIMNGKDYRFAPDEYLTRAELCTLLIRTIKYYGMPPASYLDSLKGLIISSSDIYINLQPVAGQPSLREKVPARTEMPVYDRTSAPTAVSTSIPTVIPTSEPTLLPTPKLDLALYRKRVVELVNEERAAEGKPTLIEDRLLDKTAQQHSEDMVDNNFFDHTNLKGETPFDRMNNNGISYMAAAENIAYGQRTPEAVVESWMASDGHRSNILSDSYNKIGVGIAEDAYGILYWTQDFTD